MIEPHITYRHMPHSAVLDEQICEHVGQLEKLHPRMTSCRVVVDEQDRHSQQGNLFEVHVDVRVPGLELVSTLHCHEDPYVAMREAFSSVARQLTDGMDRMRNVKSHRGESAQP